MLASLSQPRLRRQLLMLALLAVGLTALPDLNALTNGPILWRALRDGLVCALGTALGTLPVWCIRRISARLENILLSFGGGIMLAATLFSLLLPAIDAAQAQPPRRWGSSLLVAAGLSLGIAALLGYSRLLPDNVPILDTPGAPPLARGVMLFVTAIIVHNIPEGMAIGVAASATPTEANGLTLGIALQDIPEGMIVALALLSAGLDRRKAVLIGAASGLVEPLFAVLCAWLVSLSTLLLPWGLAFAAGAMLFTVVHEIIPRCQRHGHDLTSTGGLIAGFCLMMVLDTALV